MNFQFRYAFSTRKIFMLIALSILSGLPFMSQSQTQIVNFINPRFLTGNLWYMSYEYKPENKKLSYGISNTLYFKSTGLRYTGFKISPYIRFNLSDNSQVINIESENSVKPKEKSGNFYFQAKLTGGYFHSTVRYYRYEDQVDKDVDRLDLEKSYFASGFGIGLGYQKTFKQKVDIDLSIGFQSLYQLIDKSITVGKYQYDYSLGTINTLNPWLFVGPGSLVEVRISFGLVFHKQ